MEQPKLACKTCKKSFIHLSFFYDHIRKTLHSTIVCPLAVCLSNFSNLRSLQTHLSREHKFEKPFVVEDDFTCMHCPVKSCGIEIESRKEYLEHMPKHLKEGIRFQCGYPDCSVYSNTVSSFRTHVGQTHAAKLQPIDETSSNIPSQPLISDAEDSSDESNQRKDLSQLQVPPCEVQRQPQVPPSESQRQPQVEIQDENDPFAEYKIKDQLAKFYLKLEAEHFLPTSTVQVIANEIALVTEYSHHHLKKSLEPQLKDAGLADKLVNEIMENTFLADPVFNTHHKKDCEQFCTDHYRKKFWKKNYPYVEPKQYFLGRDENGRKKYAHYVSIRESIKSMLKDHAVKKKVLESFNPKEGSPNILSDFTDGSAYKKHRDMHNGGKCLYINLFQDGCDYNAFGPSVGKYKPNNFYFSLGNLCPEYRTKLKTIHLAYCILEHHLKTSEKEELNDIDVLKEALKPLLDELKDLKTNGIEIDGEVYPVCLLFCQGDNLGQHFIGGFVGSFSCKNCCRFCEVILEEFRQNPTVIKPLRTPEQYNQSVIKAKNKWVEFRRKCLATVSKRNQRLLNRLQAPGSKSTVKRILAKTTLTKLKGIHHIGVKYKPSPFNCHMLQFHCCSPSLPPCIAHDLWEGIAKNMLPQILSSFVDRKWFDLLTLNQRIESFGYCGTDKKDAPTRLKSLSSLGGNAAENATLVRLLPLIIGDLIQDQNDEMWCLYLKFKEIAEYVCAPKISVHQVMYLRTLISDYLLEVKRLLPGCLYPKQHLLAHYPELFLIFGPLAKLSTLRFESFHVFFKNCAAACKNFINFTYTLSRKYMCKFALDHATGLLEEDVSFDYSKSSSTLVSKFLPPKRNALPDIVFSNTFRVLKTVSVKGVEYRNNYYMILDNVDICDLKVGLIDTIFVDTSSNEVYFLLNVKPAVNTFKGYYHIQTPSVTYQFSSLSSIQDYYPLPSYNVNGLPCLPLKHTTVGIVN